jgi:hypothetical protein
MREGRGERRRKRRIKEEDRVGGYMQEELTTAFKGRGRRLLLLFAL